MWGLSLFGLIVSFYALLFGAFMDGWPASEPLTVKALFHPDAGSIWFYRPLVCAAIFSWFAVFIPLTYTRWWKEECGRWEKVAAVLIDGIAACCCPACDPARKIRSETARRFGLLLVLIGAMFVVGCLLQQHALARVAGVPEGEGPPRPVFAWHEGGLPTSVQTLRPLPALYVAAGLVMLVAGFSTPALWTHPSARLWLARLTMIAGLTAFFGALGEHQVLNRAAMTAGAIVPHREGVLAIVLLAGSTLGFMLLGWGFAERSSAQRDHAAPVPYTVIR